MGFVMSQSFGALHIYGEGEEEGKEEVTAFVTSGVGLTTLLSLLVLLLAFTLALGFRTSTPKLSSISQGGTTPSGKLTPASGAATEGSGADRMVLVGNPMAMPGGSCSAVISARCHLVSTSSIDEKGKGRRRSVVTFTGIPGSAGAGAGAGADTTEIWKRPLVWGVVGEGGLGAGQNEEATTTATAPVGIGHCGFAVAGRAGMVTEGRAYA